MGTISKIKAPNGTTYNIDAVKVNGKTVASDVPSNAKFTDTTYSAGTNLELDGTKLKHTNSITAGTAGTSSATSGSTFAVPYITFDARGHITAKGTHTHTVSGFLPSDGGTITGNLYRKSNAVTINTTSNNNVTSATYPYIHSCSDSADYVYAKFQTYCYTNGRIDTYLQAYNKTTAGTEINNSFLCTVLKNGTRQYGCPDRDAFKSDLGMQKPLSTTSSTTGTNGITVTKFGNVVYLYANNIYAPDAGTIPSGYRPKTTVYLPCIVWQDDDSLWYKGFLGITTAGVITVHYLKGTANKTDVDYDYKLFVDCNYVI